MQKQQKTMKERKKREKERDEKKKKKKWICTRRFSRARFKPPHDLGRSAWRGRRACDLGRSARRGFCTRPRLQRATRSPRATAFSLFLGFFFFLSSLMNTYFQELLLLLSLWVFFAVVFAVVVIVVFFVLFLDVNQVLETRFPCRCYVEKVPHQTWTTHKNRVPKTRFIDPKSSLLDSNC